MPPPRRTPHSARLPPPSAVKRGAPRHVVCSKTLVAKEGCEEEVARLCEGIMASLAPPAPATPGAPAAPTRRGVLDARLMVDAANPRTYHLWERYDCNRSLGEVNAGEEYVSFMKAVVPLCEGPVGMALYEWRDGQLGSLAVQGGPKGEGGLDDAAGGQGMAGGAGMKQTSAGVDLGNLARGDEGDSFGMDKVKKGGSEGEGVPAAAKKPAGDPAAMFKELADNFEKGLKAFKFPWES
jgi:quinol monooxygenase YgiN